MNNIAELLHTELLDKMKKSLTTIEEIYREAGGRDNPRYQFIRRQLMDAVYNGEWSYFEKLADEGLVERCECGSHVRHGYNRDCDMCHGAGWIHTPEFNEILMETA